MALARYGDQRHSRYCKHAQEALQFKETFKVAFGRRYPETITPVPYRNSRRSEYGQRGSTLTEPKCRPCHKWEE